MKKSNIRKLDTLWSKRVKELAGYVCEHCLRNGYEIEPETGAWLNSSHILGRRYRATRWLLRNGLCLCLNCHQNYDEHGPLEKDIINRCIGDERYQELVELAKHSVTKGQVYEEIEGELKK